MTITGHVLIEPVKNNNDDNDTTTPTTPTNAEVSHDGALKFPPTSNKHEPQPHATIHPHHLTMMDVDNNGGNGGSGGDDGDHHNAGKAKATHPSKRKQQKKEPFTVYVNDRYALQVYYTSLTGDLQCTYTHTCLIHFESQFQLPLNLVSILSQPYPVFHRSHPIFPTISSSPSLPHLLFLTFSSSPSLPSSERPYRFVGPTTSLTSHAVCSHHGSPIEHIKC